MNPTPQNSKKQASSLANAGVRLIKKLVYENYQDPSEDRRVAERQSVIGEAEVSITGPNGEALGDTRVFIRDSSRSGCGLWSRVEMPVGSTVMIHIASSDGKQKMQCLGRVRHCRGAAATGFAVGVKFDSEVQPMGKAC